MDLVKNRREPRARSLKFFILERGCPEYAELIALRAEGWNDALLRNAFSAHFTETHKHAAESNSESDAYWLPVMASSLKHMDEKTLCISDETPLRFLDLGCCPGGFSKYVLAKNLESQGVGVSLPVEDGGYGLAIPFPERSRFEIHWGDLTYYDICSPMDRQVPENRPALRSTPFHPGGFQLVMMDGAHHTAQISQFTHVWDAHRLLIAQLIIGMESLDTGGTLILRMKDLENSNVARFVYMIDKLSQRTMIFKPYVHATKGSFYVIGLGFGLGAHGYERSRYLQQLKRLWWELTYGGPKCEGRYAMEEDLNFIVKFETLRDAYLDRLIKLGRGAWRAQSKALMRAFTRIRRNAMPNSDETKDDCDVSPCV